MKREIYDNKMPLTVLIIITALNFGLVIHFFITLIGGGGFVLNSLQIYVLACLESAGVIFAYLVGKRRNPTVSF